MMTTREQQTAFKALVLSGIWMLARAIITTAGSRGLPAAREWRSHAIGHMDQVGQQSPEAREYRRDRTFPDAR